ncbi:hypothetical protein [Novosphingobium barchaimii]|nr:hypothetical protein [Novosphingobium barchaimii]
MKMAAPAFLLVALAACAPSDQADSGDSTFAPSNTTAGTVPDGIPGEGPGTAMTDGETSTRGAVSAADSPTATQGSSGASAAQNGSGR